MGTLKTIAIIALFLFQTSSQNYSYSQGGNDWTGTCASGSAQSPVDLENISGGCDSSMVLNLQFTVENISTTIELENDIRSTGVYSNLFATDLNGEIYGYEGEYFLIRAPAEHKIEGDGYDVELQLVHKLKAEFETAAPTRNYAIVSIFFNEDANSTGQFFNQWNPSVQQTAFQFSLHSALNGIFDQTQEYYLYEGSFSFPDCEEVVNWYIFPQVLSLTTEQHTTIKSYLSGDLNFANGNGNNRNLQPLNDRTIKRGHIECEEQFIYFFTFFIIYTFLNFFVFKML